MALLAWKIKIKIPTEKFCTSVAGGSKVCPKSEHVEKVGNAPVLTAGRAGHGWQGTLLVGTGPGHPCLEASLETTTHPHLPPQATLLEQLKGWGEKCRKTLINASSWCHWVWVVPLHTSPAAQLQSQLIPVSAFGLGWGFNQPSTHTHSRPLISNAFKRLGCL